MLLPQLHPPPKPLPFAGPWTHFVGDKKSKPFSSSSIENANFQYMPHTVEKGRHASNR